MTRLTQPAASEAEIIHTEQFWRRWRWIWSAIFIAAVLIPLPLVWGEAEVTGQQRMQLLLLTVAMLIVHGILTLFLAPRFDEIRHHLRYAVGYIAIITLFWIPMVRVSPVYFLTFGGLMSQLFIWVQVPWSIPIAFIGMILAFTVEGDVAITEIDLSSSGLWMWFFLTAAGVMLALFINSIMSENSRRQALIHELQETQAELATVERQAGVLAERQRLAHEIHDTLAQGFTSIVMHLEAAEQSIGQDDDVVLRHVDLARRTARISLDRARRVVQDLRPESLEQASLIEAIARAAAEWSEQNEIAAIVTTTGDVRTLHPGIEVTLLRAVQQALANVRNHAQAKHVNITLSYMPDVVVLDVQDDGIGIQPGQSKSEGGYGLIAMRERVEQLHGSLLVESQPNEGTTLVIEIPIEHQPA